MTSLKCALAIFRHLFAVADKEKEITNDDSQVCPGIFLHLFAVADKEKGITNDDAQVCPGNIPASLCSSG